MSEKLRPNIERSQEPEIPHSPEAHIQRETSPAEHKAETTQEEISSIKRTVEAEAKSSKEVKVDPAPPPAHQHVATRELKDEALKRSLQRVRKHLPLAEKSLSKAIHQPAIDFVSKVGEKTVARPTGILTGAIVALAGSSYVLYSAKHYGYPYNYWIIFLLFVGGYMAGLLIDLLIFTFKRLLRSK